MGARGWRHRKPPSGPLRPPASHCFPVHRCSPLFTIVRHCSAKNIVWSQCPAPPGHCLPAQNCPAWRGFARHARGGEWGVSLCPCPVRRSRSALRRASPPGSRRCREHKMNPCRERNAFRIPLAHQGDITALALHVGPCRLTGVWRFGYSDGACALRPAPTLGYGALESGVRNSEVPRGTKARG